MVCVHWLIETCAAGRLAAAFVVGSAAKGCHSIEPLACKSWADRVPQRACWCPTSKDLLKCFGPFAIMLGPLLHGCYTVDRPRLPSCRLYCPHVA
jgi:hypothetical protein